MFALVRRGRPSSAKRLIKGDGGIQAICARLHQRKFGREQDAFRIQLVEIGRIACATPVRRKFEHSRQGVSLRRQDLLLLI